MFAIKAFEYAAKSKYENIQLNYKLAQTLNAAMREKLDGQLFDIISPTDASPYILSVAAKGVRGEIILHEVNDKGLIIGTGSACSSNDKKRYSRVILACGIDEERADGVLRISFGAENTVEEVEEAANILNETVKMRKEIME